MGFYESKSIKDAPDYHKIETDEILNYKAKYKYIEAEEVRSRLLRFAEARLHGIQTLRELGDYEDINCFVDDNVRQQLLLLLMIDFYRSRPTVRNNAVRNIVGSFRKTEEVIRECERTQTIVVEKNPSDRRQSFLRPTIKTVLNYEFIISPSFLRNFGSEYRFAPRTMKLLAEWYDLRKKYFPIELHWTLATRSDRISNLELLIKQAS